MRVCGARSGSPCWFWHVAVVLLLLGTIGGCAAMRSSSHSGGRVMQKAELMDFDEGYARAPMETSAAMESPDAMPAPSTLDIATGDGGAPLASDQHTPGAGFEINIDDWLMPKAYAAEAIPDARYLIRDGDLELSVESFDQAAREISAVAEKHNGIVTDSSMEKYGDGSRTGWVKVRVPAEEFFAAWEELKGLGEVENQNVSSQDVSTQYISTVSRLKVLNTEQDTLENMLKDALEVQRTRGLGEAYSVLLKTQQRLSEVSYEIQNHEDSLAQLADRITNSTITVNINEQVAYITDEWDWGYGETMANAKKDLRIKWRGFVQGLIFFFVSGWTTLIPWAIILVILWLVYRRAILPRIRRNQTAAAARRKPASVPPETKVVKKPDDPADKSGDM